MPPMHFRVGASAHVKFQSCTKWATMIVNPGKTGRGRFPKESSFLQTYTLQTNATDAFPGSVRGHMQSFRATQNVQL